MCLAHLFMVMLPLYLTSEETWKDSLCSCIFSRYLNTSLLKNVGSGSAFYDKQSVSLGETSIKYLYFIYSSGDFFLFLWVDLAFLMACCKFSVGLSGRWQLSKHKLLIHIDSLRNSYELPGSEFLVWENCLHTEMFTASYATRAVLFFHVKFS